MLPACPGKSEVAGIIYPFAVAGFKQTRRTRSFQAVIGFFLVLFAMEALKIKCQTWGLNQNAGGLERAWDGRGNAS